MLFAKRKKGNFSQKTQLLGFFRRQLGTTKDNLGQLYHFIFEKNVVLCCPSLSRVVFKNRVCPKNLSQFLSVFRLCLTGRAWEPAPTTMGIPKIWTFHPKFSDFSVFPVLFVVPKIYFLQISPTKLGVETVKILAFLTLHEARPRTLARGRHGRRACDGGRQRGAEVFP